MSDLAHIIWAVAVLAVAVPASAAVRAYFQMRQRGLELRAERIVRLEVLTKRFEDVEKTVNWVKTEWVNSKLVRGTGK